MNIHVLTSSEQASAPSKRTAWVDVLQRLREKLGDEVFCAWFAGMKLDRVEGGVAYITAPTQFVAKHIRELYIGELVEEIRAGYPGTERAEIASRELKAPPRKSRKAAAFSDHTEVTVVDQDTATTPLPRTILVTGTAPVELKDPARKMSIKEVKRHISKAFGVGVDELESPLRSRRIVWPRQVAMYLARTITGRSLPEIGRQFGNRDHTTVLHAIRKVEDKLQTEEGFRFELAQLTQEILLD